MVTSKDFVKNIDISLTSREVIERYIHRVVIHGTKIDTSSIIQIDKVIANIILKYIMSSNCHNYTRRVVLKVNNDSCLILALTGMSLTD